MNIVFIIVTAITAYNQHSFLTNFNSAHPFIAPSSGDERGPCPGFNTMANHGHLPRNGINITELDIIEAFVQQYSLERSLVVYLLDQAFKAGIGNSENRTLSLHELSQHGLIEHDASLVHNDYYFGDNHSVNQTLVNQLVNLQEGSYITIQAVAKARRLRYEQSKAENPNFEFNNKQTFTAYSESAILLAVFGGNQERLAVDDVIDFLGNERLPTNYIAPPNPITLSRIAWLVTRLGWAGFML